MLKFSYGDLLSSIVVLDQYEEELLEHRGPAYIQANTVEELKEKMGVLMDHMFKDLWSTMERKQPQPPDSVLGKWMDMSPNTPQIPDDE